MDKDEIIFLECPTCGSGHLHQEWVSLIGDRVVVRFVCEDCYNRSDIEIGSKEGRAYMMWEEL